MDKKTIIKKFAVYGRNIHPLAVEVLIKNVDHHNLDSLIAHICKTTSSFVISREEVERAIKSFKTAPTTNDVKNVDDKPKQVVRSQENVSVKDVTGRSTCEGGIEDFLAYFNSRFEKLSALVRRRIGGVRISSLPKFKNEQVEVVGMVKDVRDYGEFAVFDLEDKTGVVSVFAGEKLKELALELLGDEVVGVIGVYRNGRIYADRIIFPDIPMRERAKKDFGIVFISDTHFGSKEFLEKEWEVFTKWLSGEVGNEKVVDLASKIKYVVIAGDIVDGVGVYPGLENDLTITDIYGQYQYAAEQLDKIPKDVKVILSVGNHDAIRQAEPQPALPKEIRDLFSNNVIHVGNPAHVDLDGLKVLIYHGRSLDDVITKIPRLSYEKPHEAMIELLKRRHLCPIYGGKTPIAPEREDWLVIDEVPDVLHCGHVHTYGVGFYRGVLVVNSSTWQAQTEFQKKMNLNPMPCNVAVYYNGEVGRLRFCK
ncbi:DNA-directed DNA polymerase II small subunit [Archaeoglobus profundus]|uniref:DNA polymerase II small subunit n=1 Tax=Archaeoglobus profundus (strain DSM 5631 / JCM 9629 / NBRC 100127 / Av18) TaxID=572546 RepID=D2RGP0_ARCPA|nr:DNA-directed DNA polymerase II small subunit [Archaeoglobus profundus]ADB57465.1 DNA-directed DNA polymerase [Archaeoglobus profundus DSM 5631]